jgi:hypothetical protein
VTTFLLVPWTVSGDDGDSCFAMTDDEQRRWYVEGVGDWPPVDPLPRRQDDPAWTVHVWDTRHNVLWDGPGRGRDLLVGIR